MSALHSMRRRGDVESGAVSAVWMVLMLAAVWAAASLVFDGGRALAAERQANTIASGAARAAIAAEQQLLVEGLPPDEQIAREAALGHAVAAGARPADVTTVVRNNFVFVRVVIRTSSVFLAVGGINDFAMTGSNSAEIVFRQR